MISCFRGALSFVDSPNVFVLALAQDRFRLSTWSAAGHLPDPAHVHRHNWTHSRRPITPFPYPPSLDDGPHGVAVHDDVPKGWWCLGRPPWRRGRCRRPWVDVPTRDGLGGGVFQEWT